MSKIPVMEIFGPTIQGEGMVIGKKTMFVRTGGCDYKCSWCDSSFTWDGTGSSTSMTAEEILSDLQKIGGDQFSHVTISGGNPALHKGIGELVDHLSQLGIETAVETQGTFWKDWLTDITDVTISPKPPSSGMTTDFAKLDVFYERLSKEQTSLKVVVFDDVDFAYAEDIHSRYPEFPFYLQVGNEDATTTNDQALVSDLLEKYEWLIDKTVASKTMNKARVLPQLHTLVWGNKRGV
ncbi:7-carboxy-7-deazaguanine synthase QueE [Alkalicoccobacillus plakortidis]|uniref:7-carboxy-7-deazaguanine synthase n=1 Tax=Alkalicoccobacillus plakortidis TaxID=444060 RepID=A0ABT0XHD0_9BACI|nr:7-carboxy-7-deazaguanine synthase QueE [Alkalicoccobacillus plakortidis]MCM2674607.1 7-carboxy-7-deazaguanine synthase QueE [Alkalicoccobacillus plakortidis]